MPFAVARAIVAFAPVGDVRERSRVERAHARVSSRGLRRSGSLPPFPIPPTLFDDARTPPPDPVRAGRRLFLAIALGVHAESSRPFARTASAAPDPSASAASLQEAAVRAFSERDFASATASLRRLADLEPSNPSWREALGQCLVDSGTTASEFRAAAAEFDAALALTASGDAISSARLLAGRALAREGSGEWTAALADYDAALATAASAGLPPDPFILNSRGNALAALGEYASARAAYLDAASGFRGASATRRERETSNAVRSDGVAFAAANAALALAQLGDLAGAKEEMRRVSRKAPGVVDARAALAALDPNAVTSSSVRGMLALGLVTGVRVAPPAIPKALARHAAALAELRAAVGDHVAAYRLLAEVARDADAAEAHVARFGEEARRARDRVLEIANRPPRAEDPKPRFSFRGKV